MSPSKILVMPVCHFQYWQRFQIQKRWASDSDIGNVSDFGNVAQGFRIWKP
jgi:hypothetical protein